MKQIDTLIPDIYALFEDPDFKFEPTKVEAFGRQLAEFISLRVEAVNHPSQLRMSNLGTTCLRKLWYMMNEPEKGEKLDGETRFKFLYGDLIEALALFLADAAGHTVEGAQDELLINGVKGHRDAIIDGVLVDVKSASPYGFKKFKEHTLEGDDAFGYIDQINAYLFASQDDPRLVEKRKAAFWAIDKTLGRMTLDFHDANGVDYAAKIDDIRAVLVQPKPPARGYADVPDGKSGNRKLDTVCSYCAFKETCWPGLQTYAYSTGPRFFTSITKEPRVEKAESF
jgi:hypothetical protein